MKLLLSILLASIFASCCIRNSKIAQFQECNNNDICSFESDSTKRLVKENNKMILYTFWDNNQVKSRGEVEYSIVEEISFVARDNTKVKKVNRKVSVSYDGKFTSFHRNGKLNEQGRYKHGFYIGVWKEFTEEGALKKKTNYGFFP
jgi:antitoxin component YwqK of YwqJK toxin-antitoxin module